MRLSYSVAVTLVRALGWWSYLYVWSVSVTVTRHRDKDAADRLDTSAARPAVSH